MHQAFISFFMRWQSTTRALKAGDFTTNNVIYLLRKMLTGTRQKHSAANPHNIVLTWSASTTKESSPSYQVIYTSFQEDLLLEARIMRY